MSHYVGVHQGTHSFDVYNVYLFARFLGEIVATGNKTLCEKLAEKDTKVSSIEKVQCQLCNFVTCL